MRPFLATLLVLEVACALPPGAPTGVRPPAGEGAPGSSMSPGMPLHGLVPASPLPPKEPGASRTAVTGCLATANEADAARFPAPAPTRDAAPPVTVAAGAGGVVVTHELTHACCLKSEVTTRLSERQVVVREKLLGSPCRCMCASSLRTTVGLLPGSWTVIVELENAGVVRRVAELPVQVP